MAKGKILVLDDSPLVRKLAEVSLQEAGYEVYTAENGEDGLKIAENIIPDLILVDFIMPVMTGSQFCTLIKENERLKDIPILLITGKGETVGQTFVEKFGVVDYFIKPFKSEDLVEKVEEILRSYTQIKIEEPHPITEEHEEITLEEKIKEEILYEDTPLTSEVTVGKEEVSSEGPKELTVESDILGEEIKMTDYLVPDEKFQQFEEEKPLEEATYQEISEYTEKIEIPMKILEEISKEIEEKPSDGDDIKEEIKTHDFIELADESLIKSDEVESELYGPKEVLSEKKEEIEEAQEILIEQEQKFQAIPIDIQEIERIIDTKLNNFSEKIIPSLNLNFENILKKYGLIKNINIFLAGKLEGLGLKNLFEFLENIKTSGLLTIFTKDSVFEILIVDGYMVYCISDRTRMRLGDKLLREFDPTELQQITEEDLSILKSSDTDYFVLEKKDLLDYFIQSLPKYKLKEIF